MYNADTIATVKGHNSVKNVCGVMVLVPCMLYICTKFLENISQGFRVIELTQSEIFKGA